MQTTRRKRLLSLFIGFAMTMGLLGGMISLNMTTAFAEDNTKTVTVYPTSQADWEMYDGQSKTSDGVTVKVVCGKIQFGVWQGANGANSFKISLASGSTITKIVISGLISDFEGEGWTKEGDQATWSGSATEVNFGTVEKLMIMVNSIAVTYELPSSSVTEAPEANTLTYSGSNQSLVTAGTAENGTMNYALGNDAATAPESGWGEEVPTGCDAGSYYVWYKAVGNEGYADTTPVCVTASIDTLKLDIAATSNAFTKGSAQENAVFVIGHGISGFSAANFYHVTVDGQEVSLVSYTVESGSIVLSFKKDYLDTLSAGDHEVVVYTKDSDSVKVGGAAV